MTWFSCSWAFTHLNFSWYNLQIGTLSKDHAGKTMPTRAKIIPYIYIMPISMDQFRYIKIHTWIRGLGSHKVINQVGINHSGSKACVLPPPPPPRGPPEPQRFPTGYPNKNSNNRKIDSAQVTMGRGKRREPLLSLLTFHFPSCPGSLFLSPQPPYNTKRPLRRREVS